MSELLFPTPLIMLASSSFTSQRLDASNDATATMLFAPKTGTIDRIGCNISNKLGTAPTYRFGVESVSGGNPSGTYLGAGNAFVDEADPATGFAWRTLGTPVSVTAGDMLAATIRYQTGTIGGSNYIDIAHSVSSAFSSYGQPYPQNMTAGSWVEASTLPVTALRYDDHEVSAFCSLCPAASLTNNLWNSTSNPLFLGNGFTPVIDMQCTGAWIAIRPANATSFNLSIYEGANTTPVATTAIDISNDWGVTSAIRWAFVPLPTTTLTAGTKYRFVLEPTTTTNNVTFVSAAFDGKDSRYAYFGDLLGCTGTSAHSWTDYVDRVYPLIPEFRGITLPSVLFPADPFTGLTI